MPENDDLSQYILPGTSAPTRTTPSSDLDQYILKTGSSSTPSRTSEGSSDLDQYILSNKSTSSPASTTSSSDDESWYSKSLVSYIPGVSEHIAQAGPIEKGVEKVASGLLSPLSLGLMMVTGGLGGLAEGAGAEVLEGLSPEIAASVSKAAGTITKLTTGLFTLQQLKGVADAVPRVQDAIKAGDYDTAKEMGTEALLGLGFAGLGAKHLSNELGMKGYTTEGVGKAIGEEQHQVYNHNLLADNYEKANKEIIKNRPLDMAAQLYHEAGGRPGEVPKTDGEEPVKSTNETLEDWRQRVLANKDIKPAVREKYANLLTLAQSLPEDVKAGSDALRQDYAKDEEFLKSIGKLDKDKGGRENYAGQHKYDINDPDSNLKRTEGPKRTKSPGFTKPRSYDTLMDAVNDGFEPKNQGLFGSRVDYIRQMGKMRGVIDAENKLLTEVDDDGRPIGVNPAQTKTIDDRKMLRLDPKTDVSKIDPDRLVTDGDKLYLDIHDYKPGPDVFKRYRVTGQTFSPGTEFSEEGETLQGEPKPEKANVLIHPDHLEAVNKAFADTSWFRKNPTMNALLKTTTGAKQALLAISPFHYTTEFLRGIQMGLSPMEALRPKEVTSDSLAMREGPKHGLQIMSDSSARGLASEGAADSGLTSKLKNVPGAGPVFEAIGKANDYLFGNNGYIDRLKAASFEKTADQLRTKNPNWSDSEVYTGASKITNAAFGGINYRQLGLSMNSVDLARLLMLAPDFTGSQVLFADAGLRPGSSIVWKSFSRISAYNFGVSRLLNLMVSGKPHYEHPFGVVSPDESKVWSIRTMPEDIWRGLTDTKSFLANRESPIVKTGIEAITGRDEHGKEVTTQREMLDMLRNTTPISMQNFVPALRKGPEETTTEGVLRGAGFAALPNLTTSEKLAQQLASGHNESGPVDADKLEAHQKLIQLEDDLRSGRTTRDQIHQMVESGQLHHADATKVFNNFKETKDLNPQAAAYLSRATRLPIKEFLKVYDVATPPEKQTLEPLFKKKRAAFFKKAANEMTVEERKSDPTYKRLRQMSPQEQPW